MWQGFTGWHALIILVVILLLFGAPKLPALARSLGQSMKILKSEVRPEKDESGTTDATATEAPTPVEEGQPEEEPATPPSDDGNG